MKVWLPLIVTKTGSEVYTRRLATSLEKLGHEVVLDEVAHFYQYAPWFSRLRPPKDTNVVVANSWNAAAFCRFGIPVVAVFHLVVHDEAYRPYKSFAQEVFHRHFVKPMEMSALKRAAMPVAVSEYVKDAMAKYLFDGGPETVLNGVDTDYFCPALDEPEDVHHEPLKLLFVGKPSLRKGFDLVAEIMAAMEEKCSLICAGDIPSKALYIEGAKYLGWIDRQQLRQAYRDSDLLLFPSRLEGFGYVAAEAMACGVPVLSIAGTAVAEIAPQPTCGFNCPPDDIGAMVRAISELVENRKYLRHLKQTTRAHVVAHLDEARWARQMERVLSSAVDVYGDRKRPGPV